VSGAIYYFPDPSGSMETIDFATAYGEALDFSAGEVFARRARSDAAPWDGLRYTVSRTSRMRVRVTLERFTGLTAGGQQLARDLSSLAAHLEGGGNIALCEDTAKAWVAYTSSLPNRGNMNLYTGGLTLTSIFTATPTAGDEVWIRGGHPTYYRELRTVSSWASPKLTLANGLRYDHGASPVIVHQRGTWFGLKLPADQLGRPILTDDSRKTYTLDMELEEDFGLVKSGESVGDSVDSSSKGWTPTFENMPDWDTDVRAQYPGAAVGTLTQGW